MLMVLSTWYDYECVLFALSFWGGLVFLLLTIHSSFGKMMVIFKHLNKMQRNELGRASENKRIKDGTQSP